MTVASVSLIAMVIYTGKETRTAMNSKRPISKQGKTDKEINFLSKVLFFVLLITTLLIFLLGQSFITSNWIIYLVRTFLLLSAIIPISMKVNLNFAKLKYTMDINRDPDLVGCTARNSSIPEELGRIQYLLSDKTGTLTRNEMILKVIATPQRTFGVEQSKQLKELLEQDDNPEMQLLFNCVCLCNNVSPVMDSGERNLQASSPDEISLVKFAESLGYLLVERQT